MDNCNSKQSECSRFFSVHSPEQKLHLDYRRKQVPGSNKHVFQVQSGNKVDKEGIRHAGCKSWTLYGEEGWNSVRTGREWDPLRDV